MKTRLIAVIGLCAITRASLAETRTSTDYATEAEAQDSGGRKVASVDYAADCSIGGFGGLAVAPSSDEAIKSGYIGQVCHPVSLTISASSTNLNEGSTGQLGAMHTMDDGTLLNLPESDVAWSVISGPIDSVSADGLVTAGHVYRDSPATVGASAGGLSASMSFVVVNQTSDDCGLYAADGIDDDWQVTYFGTDNPEAGPDKDPDCDGRDNRFEALALTVPTDPSSRFDVRPMPTISQTGLVVLVFGPIRSGRSYTVLYSKDLSPSGWDKLTGAAWQDSGNYRTVTDTNISGSQKFYRVQIGR